MSNVVEIDVIAPIPGKRRFKRSQILRCKVSVTDPDRVVVRLADQSVMVVTKTSLDRADVPVMPA